MVEGQSVVVPLAIEALPVSVEAMGMRWERKLEFHMTAISARKLEAVGAGRPDLWDVVTRVCSGRDLGPIDARRELRRARHPEQPELQTLIVMVDAPALVALHEDLSAALGVTLELPPAHVTLYSTDPASGIGIDDLEELEVRAPALGEGEQREVLDAIGFDAVFSDEDTEVLLGRTDRVFTPMVMRALAYAADVHVDQLRKGTAVPYLAHLIAVAALVAEEGGGEHEVTAALLHDAAEDHGGEERLEDIERRFGPLVAEIVRALSDSLLPEGTCKEAWRPRKERYLEHLRSERRDEVLRVSNADKVHNARAILADHRVHGDAVWDRFEAPPAQQRWYYEQLAAIFEDRRPGAPLAGELTEAVRELSRIVG